MNSGDYKVISVLINAFLGPVSLRYYLNYGLQRNSLNESLFLYSLLWWIYYIIYTFPYFFKLYYGEEYGLILESEPDIGTKVIVVVPKTRQAEKK